jgi:hypothetical protein
VAPAFFALWVKNAEQWKIDNRKTILKAPLRSIAQLLYFLIFNYFGF